jgi:hypothetical protein
MTGLAYNPRYHLLFMLLVDSYIAVRACQPLPPSISSQQGHLLMNFFASLSPFCLFTPSQYHNRLPDSELCQIAQLGRAPVGDLIRFKSG